jgi:hypothetical protein
MNCPGCGYANEEAAKACNLCGKLLTVKATPAPVQAAAADRVPSWTNGAILCLLFTPAVLLIVGLYMLNREDDGMGPPDGPPSSVWLWISSLGCLAATLPLAARLAYAPHGATAIVALVWVLDKLGNPAPASPLSWLTFGGVALAWVGRSGCTRDIDGSKVLGWARQGYRRLLRPDRWAALRLIAGVILFLAGIAFMVAAGTALSRYIPVSRPLARFLAIPAVFGGFLAASGLSLFEAPGSEGVK